MEESKTFKCELVTMSANVSSIGFGDMDDIPPVKENHTLQFESPSHTGTLLSGLNSLRNKNLLVDVTLIVGGQSFEVSFNLIP